VISNAHIASDDLVQAVEEVQSTTHVGQPTANVELAPDQEPFDVAGPLTTVLLQEDGLDANGSATTDARILLDAAKRKFAAAAPPTGSLSSREARRSLYS
jgi:hypothetical protein